jgi:hypothetical protein
MVDPAEPSVAFPDADFQTTWPSRPLPVPAPAESLDSRSCAVVDSVSGNWKLLLYSPPNRVPRTPITIMSPIQVSNAYHGRRTAHCDARPIRPTFRRVAPCDVPALEAASRHAPDRASDKLRSRRYVSVIRPVKRIFDPRVACATFRGETDANGRSGRLLLVRTSGVIRPGSSHHECSRRIWPPHSPRVSPFHLISRNERSRPSASTGLMAARPSEHFRPGAVTGPARQEGCSACPRKRRAGRRGAALGVP